MRLCWCYWKLDTSRLLRPHNCAPPILISPLQDSGGFLNYYRDFCISFSAAFYPWNKAVSAAICSNRHLFQHKPLFTGPASIKGLEGGVPSCPTHPAAQQKIHISKASTTPEASHFSGRRMKRPVPKWPYQKPPGHLTAPYSDQTGTIPRESVGPMTNERHRGRLIERPALRESEREHIENKWSPGTRNRPKANSEG